MSQAYGFPGKAEDESGPERRKTPAYIGNTPVANTAEVVSFSQKMSGEARGPSYL